MRAHPVNKLLQQTCYKSAASLLQVVHFYVCMLSPRVRKHAQFNSLLCRVVAVGSYIKFSGAERLVLITKICNVCAYVAVNILPIQFRRLSIEIKHSN